MKAKGICLLLYTIALQTVNTVLIEDLFIVYKWLYLAMFEAQ